MLRRLGPQDHSGLLHQRRALGQVMLHPPYIRRLMPSSQEVGIEIELDGVNYEQPIRSAGFPAAQRLVTNQVLGAGPKCLGQLEHIVSAKIGAGIERLNLRSRRRHRLPRASGETCCLSPHPPRAGHSQHGWTVNTALPLPSGLHSRDCVIMLPSNSFLPRPIMSNENIFKEIDEELRSDRMRAMWRRFAPFVIGGAIAIVALVAVNEGWSWYTKSQSAASSEQLYSALNAAESGDLATAQAELDALAANGSGGYPVLAEFRKAALLAEQGDAAGAVAAYDALANSQSNQRLRELALLLAGGILVDTGSVADVEARVGTLATDDAQMRRVARELLGLAQYKAGDFAAAEANFEAVINDPLAQSPVRNRMAYYLAQMLSQGVSTAEAPTEAAAEAIDAIVQDDAAASADEPAAEPAAEPADE